MAAAMIDAKLSEKIEAPVGVLDQVMAKLVEKRVAVEKVVLQYGEAPAGIKEVFELCRGFERSYVNLINDSPIASKIKDCFSGDQGLAGAVKKLPHEKVFKLDHVKSTCRVADGYQPSLVSPENGMRKLADDALEQVVDPVNSCVQQVYTLLLNSAREAAEKAGHFTEAALVGAMPMYVPEFKNVVMPAIITAMDEWKQEAVRVALMLVEMERSYITAGFFRQTQHNRYNKIRQQEAMRSAMATKGPAATGIMAKAGGIFGSSGGSSTAAGGASGGGKAASYFPSFGTPAPSAPPPGAPRVVGDLSPPTTKDPKEEDGSEGSDDDKTDRTGSPFQKKGTNPGIFNAGTDPDDFSAAFFEKYSSNDSARSSLPESWRWQKRFFVFGISQKTLYYFKSPEDVHKQNGLRGQVLISDCVIDDLDDRGNIRGPSSKPVDTNDKSTLMIRVRGRHNSAVVKDHSALILRAESSAQKGEWLARLRLAAMPSSGGGKKPDGSSRGDGATPPATPGDAVHRMAGAVKGALFDDQSDLEWAKELEPVLDNHLGQGARAFRADAVRDSSGRLLLAPTQLLNPLRMVDRARGRSTDPFQQRMDGLLEQHGQDMSIYMQMVCDTIVITVPKAIVHCMIRKSEKNVLEKLFTVIHHLSDVQMKQLLKEDDDIVAKRKAARKALEDVKTAVFQVQTQLERQSMATAAERRDKVPLPASVFAYASMADFLTPDQRKAADAAFADPHTPEVMRFGYVPRAPPPPVTRASAAAAAREEREARDAAAMFSGAAPALARPSTREKAPAAAISSSRGVAVEGSAPSISRPAPGPPTDVRRAPPAPGAGTAGGAGMGAPMVRRPPPPPPK